ncbi:hypothetical protein [Parasitella parasitica]|uniref:Uncharacterized protein n=1 Tax=Parasitella parasitica TaxID=35722 RepID=A0A0B7NHF1_9FUNG|nr:hypothetical protein [Parasitella parasitica]
MFDSRATKVQTSITSKLWMAYLMIAVDAKLRNHMLTGGNGGCVAVVLFLMPGFPSAIIAFYSAANTRPLTPIAITAVAPFRPPTTKKRSLAVTWSFTVLVLISTILQSRLNFLQQYKSRVL